ncbi:MAG: hypothetical protein ABIJ10_03585 [Candidatus Micrarchaeota archaeon]
MRAFIFSLDAFVAFSLALIAIYSLIFFSSIPSSHYYLMTQAHFLARDSLMALSTTTCSDAYVGCPDLAASLTDNVVSQSNADLRRRLIADTVGDMVPNQFGYILEMSDSAGGSWNTLYDTANPALRVVDEYHEYRTRKLSVSSQVITFGFDGAITLPSASEFKYNTCGGAEAPLITCGLSNRNNPSDGGELVPRANIGILKLTIFI